MKIVYPICCGLDVHKNSVVATIVKSDKAGGVALSAKKVYHNQFGHNQT